MDVEEVLILDLFHFLFKDLGKLFSLKAQRQVELSLS